MDLIQEMFFQKEVWYTSYNFWFGLFTSIGTVGAVIVSVCLSRPKKEKLECSYSVSNFDCEAITLLVSVKNKGHVDAVYDSIKIFDNNEKLIGFRQDNNSHFKNLCITFFANTKNNFKDEIKIPFFAEFRHFCYISNWEHDYKNHISKILLYTSRNDYFEVKYDKNLKP